MSAPRTSRDNFTPQTPDENPQLGAQLDKPFAAADGSQSGSTATFLNAAESQSTLTMLPLNRLISDRFRIIRCVGIGGMGEVYEAEDIHLGQRVALKTIRPDIAGTPVAVARFKREILMGKRVTHPNVCRIYDLGLIQTNADPLLFLTMEFLEGETLATRLKRGRLSPEEALPLLVDMSNGLSAAHQAGVIHRDLKSSNVILVPSDGRDRAVITDFGLARPVEKDDEGTALTETGGVGTVAYMSPEQVRGDELTPASDIYSLGIIAYEMVTGEVPFRGESALEIAAKQVEAAPRPPRQIVSDLDENWEAVILRCLRKPASERFSSAADVKEALCGPVVAVRQRRGGRKWAWASLIFLAVTATAGFFIYRSRSARPLPAEQRVAVLEFENVGGDPSNGAFCEGLMENISNKLTNLQEPGRRFSVIPASDIRRDHVGSAREALRDFGANLVITGSVQRSPDGLRLIVNLVDARKLTQLKSSSAFISSADPVMMQLGVIAQITSLLDVPLRPAEKQTMGSGDTPVPGAYDFYLQGLGYLLAGRNSVDNAIAEFRLALERDASFARAHAGLGEAYWTKYLLSRDRSWIDQAWQECNRAAQLGPQLAEPHITLAILNSGTGKYDEAMKQARLAIEIAPADDRGFVELARVLEATHQPQAAEATLKQAIALRPNYWRNYERLGIFYATHNRYQEAVSPFARVIELVPDNPAGYTDLGSTYHYLGRESDAEKLLRKSLSVRPTATAYSDLATVYFFEQRFADAIPLYRQVISNGSRNYAIWGNLGDAYRWTPGNGKNAADAYQRAINLASESIEVNPRDAVAVVNRGLYYAKIRESAEAVRDMRRALAIADDNKLVLF